eukprot:CAMPEP_0113475716 /NCGR_PEP_ID=MMETSP0014_2-20120614/19269_1 /TAXON_ID=2857 /ORGANISM="Nitzschia sp." /LENGTH=793 /DNA_ID=CAMNT_0000368655 /DNA_START=295 /DNA_END=2673 /DNA_ORIENTATION=- /assembly_acc=CAM_ASM_000159
MVRKKRRRRRRRIGMRTGGGSRDCSNNNIDINVVDRGGKMKRENVSGRGGHHQNSIDDDDDDDDDPALLSSDLILSQKSTKKIRQIFIPTVLTMRRKKQRNFSSCYHRKRCIRSHPSSHSLPPHRHRHFFLVRSCISPKLYALAALLIVTLTMSNTAAVTTTTAAAAGARVATGMTSQEVTTNDIISSRILGDYSRPNQNNDGSMTDYPVIGATNNGGGEEESGDSEDDDYEYSDDPVAANDNTEDDVPSSAADADAVIDCDRFEHLAEEMPQCQDEDDFEHVFNGNGTDTIEAASRPTNEVHFQFDLVVFVPQSFLDERESGKEMMYGLPPRIHKLARLAVATVVSRVLDDLTDYRVVLKGDQSWKAKPPSRRQRRHRRTSDGESEDEEEKESKEDDEDEDEEETEDGNESESEVVSSSLRDDVNDVTAGTSSSPPETVDPNFDPSEPWKNRITLLHKWTWLHLYDESDHGRHRLLQEYPSLADISATEADSGEVLVFRATLLYGAKWKETREPVSEPRLMDEINEDCATVLWDAIDDGTFLRAVGRSIEHTKDFLFDSNGIVIERYSIDDDQVNEKETVVFLEIRSTDGTASSTPYHGNEEGGIFPDHTSVDERGSGTFNEPLEPEWGVREWCGVALAASTLVFAALLSASASFLSRRQTLHSRWGSMFTEQGVAELLHVGWRYHDDGNMMPETSSAPPQLFLQVYDRRKSSFYNEENSMLQGGAEQEFFVPTGIAGTPTSAPTTSVGMTQTNGSHTNGGRTEGDRSRTASGSGSGSLQPSTTSPSPEKIP